LFGRKELVLNFFFFHRKKYFIQFIQILQKHQLIDSNYKIIFNGKLYDKDELTSKNISEGFVVYEKLAI